MKRRRVKRGKRTALTHVRIPCPRPVRVHQPAAKKICRPSKKELREEAEEP